MNCNILLQTGGKLLLQAAGALLLTDCVPQDNPVGGGGLADYRQYQKKLRRIAAAADKRLYKKASKRIEVLAKEDLPPVIERQVAAIQIDLNAILDKGVLAQNTLLIEQIKKLDLLIEQFILQQQKREDEIIILLMA